MKQSNGQIADKDSEMFTMMKNACIGVYLSYHVSQLRDLNEQVVDVWYVGQKLYGKLQKAQLNG